jgi:hypothetical protein
MEGICLYPILDRPDWEDPDHWHNSGLWDLRRNGNGALERVLNQEYAAELLRSQALLASASTEPKLQRNETSARRAGRGGR